MFIRKLYQQGNEQFVTTYFCESGFPSPVAIKIKSQNRSDVEGDMRNAVPDAVPDFQAKNTTKTTSDVTLNKPKYHSYVS